jgi:hypothetical protein
VVVASDLVASLRRPLGIGGQLDEVDCKGFPHPVAAMRLNPGEVRSISSLSRGDGEPLSI